MNAKAQGKQKIHKTISKSPLLLRMAPSSASVVLWESVKKILHNQRDRQADKVQQKHDLLDGGNYPREPTIRWQKCSRCITAMRNKHVSDWRESKGTDLAGQGWVLQGIRPVAGLDLGLQ